MKIFTNIIGVSINGVYQIVSIAMVDEVGCKFYGEFREFDELIPVAPSENLYISKMIGDLKYKSVEFIDGITPFYTISYLGSDRTLDKYSLEIKAHKNQIMIELNSWLRLNLSDNIEYCGNSGTLHLWNMLMEDHQSPMLIEMGLMEIFDPINLPQQGPMVINALSSAEYMANSYKLLDGGL